MVFKWIEGWMAIRGQTFDYIAVINHFRINIKCINERLRWARQLAGNGSECVYQPSNVCAWNIDGRKWTGSERGIDVVRIVEPGQVGNDAGSLEGSLHCSLVVKATQQRRRFCLYPGHGRRSPGDDTYNSFAGTEIINRCFSYPSTTNWCVHYTASAACLSLPS